MTEEFGLVTAPDPSQDTGQIYGRALDTERRAQLLERVNRLRQNAGVQPVVPDEVGMGEPQMGVFRRVAADVAKGTIESPRAVTTGVVRAGEEFLETVGQIVDPLSDAVAGALDPITPQMLTEEGLQGTPFESPEALGNTIVEFLGGDPESVTGGVIQGITQFTTGFLGGRNFLRLVRGGAPATRLGTAAEAAAAGVIADVFTLDEIDGNLSSLVQSVPALQNPITEFMETDPDDPVAVNKLKQAAEGLVVGSAVDLLVGGIRYAKSAKEAMNQTTQSAVEKQARKAATAGLAEQELPNLEILQLQDKPGDIKPGPAFRIDDSVQGQATAFLEGKINTAAETRVGNVNLNRISGDEDITEVIRKTAKMFEDKVTTSPRQTNEETIKLANEIGADPDRMKEVVLGRENMSAAEITALRFHLNSSAQRLQELAVIAKEGDSAGQYEFMRQFNFHKALLERTSAAAREAGRTLQALQIQGTTAADATLAVKDLLDTGLPVKDLAMRVASAGMGNGKLGIHAMAQMPENVWRRGGDAVLEFWTNALLAGPKTHVVNFTSNAIVNLALSPLERLTAIGIGKALRQDGVYWSEAGAMAFAIPRGIRDGFKLSMRSLLDEDVADAFTKLDAPRTRSSNKPISAKAFGMNEGTAMALGVDMLGKVVRTPGRALNAADMFWKSVGYRMQLHADSWQRAMTEVGDQGSDALARRYSELLDNPPPDLHAAGIDMARYNTFTNPLGDSGRAFSQSINKFPPARLIFPFIRTPVNILKFVGHRSPLAVMSPKFHADMAAGGNRARLAMARLGLGSMAMASFADLAAQGHITGSGPADARLKASLRRDGWQPYSIKVGDQYLAYNRLDPVGLTMGIAADLSQIVGQLEDEEVDNVLGPVLTAVSENFINKTYLSGLSNAMEVVTAPSEAYGEARGERFIANLAGSFVPNLMGQSARAIDPTLRRAEGIVQNVMRRIPGLSDNLPPRLNLWGEPIILPGGFSENLISPIYRSEAGKGSQMDKVINENQIPVSMPSRKISFQGMDGEMIELTQEQHNRFIELAGNELKEPTTGMGAKDILDAIATGRTDNAKLRQTHELFKRATGGPEGGKAAIIKDVLSTFRTAAKAQLFAEDAELRRSVAQKRRRRLELLGVE